MVEALARRGQRVRLRTPYSDELTALEVAYLEHAGLTVASSAGLGIVDDLEIAAVAPDTLRALVSGDDDAADVVMLSCTNVRALAVLPMLPTGRPRRGHEQPRRCRSRRPRSVARRLIVSVALVPWRRLSRVTGADSIGECT